MRYNYAIDSLDDFENADRSAPMTAGEHTCKVIWFGDTNPKPIQVWYEGRQDSVDVRSVMVRFADTSDPAQTVVDFFKLPVDDAWSAERYFRGTSNPKDRLPNFHFRKAASFLSKLGFSLNGDRQLPEQAWDPNTWLELDVILTAQVESRRPTNASQVMDGVSDLQASRMEVKPFSYRPTPAGLKRQAGGMRPGASTVAHDDEDDQDIPF
jgi:hypothetical protein